MQTNSFLYSVHSEIAATPIVDRLIAADAVVLERIARGGGATNWYYCPDLTKLAAVEERLLPGSVVSFYFDDRIIRESYTPEIRSKIERIVSDTGEIQVGVLHKDRLRIEMEIITGINELADFWDNVIARSEVFFGVFPARDNDGVSAVTVTLPDIDGIVRAHPH